MTGSGEHAWERWRGFEAVVAAYAGTASGRDALRPALHALRRALPAARLWLLCPAEGRPCAPDNTEDVIEYSPPSADPVGDDTARDTALRAVDALSRCGARAALVFAEEGIAPYEPAYLCYLAGIVYRAGFETEFAGGVLSPALPYPKDVGERERHLALLAAAGLVRSPDPDSRSSRSAAATTNRSTTCGR